MNTGKSFSVTSILIRPRRIADNTDAFVRELRELQQVRPDATVAVFVKWWNERMARSWPRHDGPTILIDHVREFRSELKKIEPYLFFD